MNRRKFTGFLGKLAAAFPLAVVPGAVVANQDIDYSATNKAKFKRLMEIQGSRGNWDHDPYMHGMYNGMELARATFGGVEPEYRSAPDQWLANHEANPPQPAIDNAIQTLSAAFKNDPGFAYSWHCVVAVCSQDEGMEHAASNRAASRFMKMAFGVETSYR